MDGYRPNTYGDAFADVYDRWYHDLPGADDALACLRRLAQGPDNPSGGAVLELGCGTGRLCLPLAQGGLRTVGLDASAEMLARLQAKPGAAALTTELGDMAGFDLHHLGPFSLVFVAFNSLFNLPSGADQARCFATVAEHLAPGGRFALECFVPGDPPDGPVDAIDIHTITADTLVLRASRQDPTSQTVAGQHVEITNGSIRLRPWQLRYATPAELDEMAKAAGLVVESRWGDWAGGPFTEECQAHVSVYRRPAQAVTAP